MKYLYITLIFLIYIYLLYIGENSNKNIEYYFYNILILILVVFTMFSLDYVFEKKIRISLLKKIFISFLIILVFYLIYVEFDSNLIVYMEFSYVLPLFVLIIFHNIF